MPKAVICPGPAVFLEGDPEEDSSWVLQPFQKGEPRFYLEAANAIEWFRHPEVTRRTILEEFARDSVENLLFGICRFRECTGEYPEHVTVIGWAFKSERSNCIGRRLNGRRTGSHTSGSTNRSLWRLRWLGSGLRWRIPINASVGIPSAGNTPTNEVVQRCSDSWIQ
jgi:hypothetical protein